MSLTFTDAVERVREDYAEAWSHAHPGLTFYIAPDGLADDDDYAVTAGAREIIVEEDYSLLVLDSGTAVLVSRETGAVRYEPTLDVIEKISKMTPVSVLE